MEQDGVGRQRPGVEQRHEREPRRDVAQPRVPTHTRPDEARLDRHAVAFGQPRGRVEGVEHVVGRAASSALTASHGIAMFPLTTTRGFSGSDSKPWAQLVDRRRLHAFILAERVPRRGRMPSVVTNVAQRHERQWPGVAIGLVSWPSWSPPSSSSSSRPSSWPSSCFAAVFFVVALAVPSCGFAAVFAAVFFAGLVRDPLVGRASGLGRLGLVDAALQGREQVDDLGLLALGLRRLGDVAALDLPRDELAHGLGVVVLELLRLVVARQGVDERGGHRELLVRRVRLLRERLELGVAHLVRPEQRLQDDDAVAHAEHGQGHPGAHRDGDERHPVGLLERVAQQDVRLEAGLVGLEVVARVEEQRVDLLRGHELLDRDLLGRPCRQALHVLVGEHDHLAIGRLIALGDVGVGHLLAVDRADALVLDAPSVLLVDLPELHVVVLGRREESDRHIDEAERHGAFPDGSHENKNAPMRPMLATPTTTIPVGDDWQHEVKWDGMRVLADVTRGLDPPLLAHGTRRHRRLSRAARLADGVRRHAPGRRDRLRCATACRPSPRWPSASTSPTRGGRRCSPRQRPSP